MTNRDGEDVCGCRTVAIDCVFVSTLLEADGLRLTRSDYNKHMTENKKSLEAWRTVNRPAND